MNQGVAGEWLTDSHTHALREAARVCTWPWCNLLRTRMAVGEVAMRCDERHIWTAHGVTWRGAGM